MPCGIETQPKKKSAQEVAEVDGRKKGPCISDIDSRGRSRTGYVGDEKVNIRVAKLLMQEQSPNHVKKGLQNRGKNRLLMQTDHIIRDRRHNRRCRSHRFKTNYGHALPFHCLSIIS